MAETNGENYARRLGERIAKARKAAGLSQELLGKRTTISRYESGTRVPDAEELVRIARECNVSPCFLLLGEHEMMPIPDQLRMIAKKLEEQRRHG